MMVTVLLARDSVEPTLRSIEKNASSEQLKLLIKRAGETAALNGSLLEGLAKICALLRDGRRWRWSESASKLSSAKTTRLMTCDLWSSG